MPSSERPPTHKHAPMKRRAKSVPNVSATDSQSLLAAHRWLFSLLVVAALTTTFVLIRGRAASINSRRPESTNVFVPRNARTASSLAPATVATTYTWNGGPVASWQVATNWTPTRVLPATSDVLIFNASSVTVTNVPTEEIAELDLTNGATVTLKAETTVPAGAKTLTVSGGPGGTRLSVPSGNSLTLAGTTSLTISVASGSTGLIDGEISLLNGAHKLVSADASGVIFQDGSIFTVGHPGDPGFTGSPFGSSTDHSVVFDDGSSAFFNEGDDPFGGPGHSVVTFTFFSSQSIFKSSAFSSNGRAYGRLTLDGSQSYLGSGSGLLTVFNLTIVSGSMLTLSNSSGGDLNLFGDITINGTLNQNGRAVKFTGGGFFGNIQTIVSGGTFDDVIISKVAGRVTLGNTTTINGALKFDGGSSVVDVLDLNSKTLNLNGTVGGTSSSPANGFKGSLGSTLNIGGTGALGTLRFISGAQILTSLTVNRTSSGSVTLGTNLTIGDASTGSLTLTNGLVDVGSNTLSLAAFPSISRTNGYVIGNLQKTFGAATNFIFHIGTSNGYSPVDANVTTGTFPASLAAKAVGVKHPNISGTNALQRYWTLANSGSLTADLTFHYLAADVVGTEASYNIFKYDGGFTQFTPNTLNTVSHFATLNGVSSFSDWTLAEGWQLQFSASSYDDAEGTPPDGDHTVTITVERVGGTSGAASVHYATSDGTATAGSDYEAASGDFNWADGVGGSQSFNITVHPDAAYEADETVILTLSSPSGGAIGGTNPAQLTILNDDAPPATLVVTKIDDTDDALCDADCSLREAIHAANLLPDTNTITFDPTAFAAAGSPYTITVASELFINSDVTINGPADSRVIVSGGNITRVFSVNAGTTVAISNLTIANGQANFGGGIFNLGNLTISNSTFTGNKAVGGSGEGGAIDSEDGILTIVNSTISGNTADGPGGGLLNCGTSQTTLTNVTITNNRANNAQSSNTGGGGIGQISSNPITLNNTIVAVNDAYSEYDVGLFTLTADDVNCEISFSGSTVDPNSMNNLIGTNTGLTGINSGDNGNQIGTSDTPINPLLGSLAANGGPTFTHLLLDFSPAIDAGSNSVAVDQNNNALTTDQRGSGFPRIVHTTVDIGAVEIPFVPPPPSADVRVTKTANVSESLVDKDITYTITVTNAGPDAAASLTFEDTQSQINPGDPFFTPQPGTLTFVSLSSPAGWSCTTPSAGTSGAVSCTQPSLAVSSDQVFTLVVHIPSGTAHGTVFINTATVSSSTSDPTPSNNSAFAETTAVTCFANPTVTTNADSGAGSLRQAIADACDGATITFDPALNGQTITLTSAELAVSKNLTIQGPGANLLTVQRSAAGGTPQFRIFATGTGLTVNISGLTIAGGLAAFANDGGGISNQSNTLLTLTGVKVSGNRTADAGVSPAGLGGGIFNRGTLQLINSTVNGNTTGKGSSGGSINGGDGGGIYNNSGVLTLINSTISGNQTGNGSLPNGHDGNGGGIYNSSGSMTLTNSTISGNTTGTSPMTMGGIGAGIYVQSGALTLKNCTVSHNIASSSGGGSSVGGIRNGGSPAILGNTIIANNGAVTFPDLSGLFNSQDYNLIKDPTGATFTGTTTHNIIGVDPLLGSLANNGGPTQTRALLPGSPAINAGSNANLPADTFDLDSDANTAEPIPFDQRGFARVTDTTVDIGAFESRGFTIAATSGTPQSATINTAFGSPLVATVSSTFGEPVAGGQVTFTAPASGASGTFAGGGATNTVTISGGGVATSPTFTANGIVGSYNVTASLPSGAPSTTFALTNTAAGQTITVNTHAPSSAAYDSTFTVAATSSSGLTVTYSSSGACTNVGATFTMTSGTGTCTVKYDQSGNGTYSAAPQVTEFVTAQKAITNTVLNSSVNPSNIGQSVTFTATVTSTAAGALTGNVTFKDNGVAISGCSNKPLTSGQATCDTAALAPGNHPITADYNGDPHFATSTGTLAGGQVVNSDVSVTVSPASVAEDGVPNLVYTFTRNGVTASALTINFSVGGTATFTTDYAQTGAASFNTTAGTVTFGAGNSTATVTINPAVDATVEGDETVILTVTAGTGYTVGSPSAATGTITDDDTSVSVAVAPSSVDEDGEPNLVYTFTRNGVTANAMTINFSVGGTATFTTDYSQTGAASFNTTAGTVTFDAGNLTATVTINPSTDTELEPNETVILTVTAGSGYEIINPTSATGTITNDDTALQLLLDPQGPASNQAVAVDSILFVRDPFPIDRLEKWFNFPGDDNTRVMLFAYFQLLPGETANDVVVEVIDSASHVYNVTAEDVRLMNCPPCSQPMSQILFRLPDMPAGTVTVRVKVHALTSNAGTFRVTN
jgi:CSLREA domain-containing protein